MTVTKIFSGATTAGVGITSNIGNASALYLICPDIIDEVEVDFYLQIAISTENRLIKLNDFFTLDTVSIYPIPNELRFLELPIYGIFLSSSPFTFEIWALYPEKNDNSTQLDSIEEKINLLAEQNALIDDILEGFITGTMPLILQQTIPPLLGTVLPPLLSGGALPPLLLPPL